MIHSAIHIARPDVLCAAHTHSIHGKAFSTLGVELDMLTQDTCAFYTVSAQNRDYSLNCSLNFEYQDHVLYDNFKGVVLDVEEGQHIASVLGSKKVIFPIIH